jgi:hypothetical protein
MTSPFHRRTAGRGHRGSHVFDAVTIEGAMPVRQRLHALRLISVGLSAVALSATVASGQAFGGTDSRVTSSVVVTPDTVRSAIDRNVQLVIGVTTVSSTQVKLGTVTMELVDTLGHSHANYDFRLYIASKLIKNDNHTCTYGECAQQWHINTTYPKGTVVIGRMVVPGSSDVGAPRLTL